MKLTTISQGCVPLCVSVSSFQFLRSRTVSKPELSLHIGWSQLRPFRYGVKLHPSTPLVVLHPVNPWKNEYVLLTFWWHLPELCEVMMQKLEDKLSKIMEISQRISWFEQEAWWIYIYIHTCTYSECMVVACCRHMAVAVDAVRLHDHWKELCCWCGSHLLFMGTKWALIPLLALCTDADIRNCI